MFNIWRYLNEKHDIINKILSILFLILIGGLFYIFYTSNLALNITYIVYGIVSLYGLMAYITIDLTTKSEKPKMKKYPSVTILIPCYNSEKTIKRVMDHVMKIKYPSPLEIIAIDDGSKDKTFEILKKYPIKIIRRKTNHGKAAGLNLGIKMAKGEIIACLDSDTYPPEDVLLKGVPYFYTKPDVGAVTFFITVDKPKTIWQKMQRIEYFSGFGFVPKTAAKINGLTVAPGPLSLFKKSVLEEIGGFDEKNITEDMEIGLKIQDHKYKIEYCPEVEIPTDTPDTLGKLYKQRIRWYRGTIFNLDKYKHMFFNKSFKDLGVFVFPVVTTYVILVILSFLMLSSMVLKSLVFFIQQIIIYMEIGFVPKIKLPEIIINSANLFLFFTVLAWVYYLYKSIKMTKKGIGFEDIFPIILTLFLYPILNSFFYITSLYKEIKRSDLSW